MKKTITLLAVVLLVAIAGFAQNRPPMGGNGNGPGGGPAAGAPGPRVDVIVDYLALTDEQKATWQTLHEEFRTSIEAVVEQRRALEEQLRTLIDGGTTDAAAVGALVLQIHATESQIKAAHDALDQKINAMLTADQQVKYAAFQAALEALRGPGGPGGPRN